MNVEDAIREAGLTIIRSGDEARDAHDSVLQEHRRYKVLRELPREAVSLYDGPGSAVVEWAEWRRDTTFNEVRGDGESRALVAYGHDDGDRPYWAIVFNHDRSAVLLGDDKRSLYANEFVQALKNTASYLAWVAESCTLAERFARGRKREKNVVTSGRVSAVFSASHDELVFRCLVTLEAGDQKHRRLVKGAEKAKFITQVTSIIDAFETIAKDACPAIAEYETVTTELEACEKRAAELREDKKRLELVVQKNTEGIMTLLKANRVLPGRG